MKLFYHFLIFVFASLILIACANIFNSDSETRNSNHAPSALKHGSNSRIDSSAKSAKQNNPYVITTVSYKRLLKTKRWTDRQCTIIEGLRTYIWESGSCATAGSFLIRIFV
jgi:hypothetical protein